MIFNKQVVKHDPANGAYGDCWRTCIACLLNLQPEEVPHFTQLAVEHGEDLDCDDRTREWLRKQGYDMACIPFQGNSKDWAAKHLGSMPYILTGKSPNFPDVAHCVIGRGGFELVWDPAPSGKGLSGPCVTNDGQEIYFVYILTQVNLLGELL